MMLNGSPPPPKRSHLGASTARCCQSPSRPSKGWPGPVIPSAASSAANTPVRMAAAVAQRSEEHTSELQSLAYLVCRLLLEKKNESVNALPGLIPLINYDLCAILF